MSKRIPVDPPSTNPPPAWMTAGKLPSDRKPEPPAAPEPVVAETKKRIRRKKR